MAELVFTDNSTSQVIVGTLTAAMASETTQKNIADLTDGGNQVKILAAADTSNTFKISHIRYTIIGGAFTGTPDVYLFLKVGAGAKMIHRYRLFQNDQEVEYNDLILPAGSEIWAGISALPGGAGSELNITLKLAEYVV